MPISAVAGRAELMDDLEDVFFSGTHGGETLSLAAAARGPRPARRRVHTSALLAGERLRAGVREARSTTAGVGGLGRPSAAPRRGPSSPCASPQRSAAAVSRRRALVQQELLKRGVLFNGSNFISSRTPTTTSIAAVDAYGVAFGALADGLRAATSTQRLEGGPSSRPSARSRDDRPTAASAVRSKSPAARSAPASRST